MSAGAATIARGWREGRWFLVALLLALASALVPALCAPGAPASRATGSAFDPTTSAVALRGRAQAIARAEHATNEGIAGAHTPKASPPLGALIPVPPVAAAGLLLAHPAPDGGRSLAPPAAIRRMTRARPRAPPLANG